MPAAAAARHAPPKPPPLARHAACRRRRRTGSTPWGAPLCGTPRGAPRQPASRCRCWPPWLLLLVGGAGARLRFRPCMRACLTAPCPVLPWPPPLQHDGPRPGGLHLQPLLVKHVAPPTKEVLPALLAQPALCAQRRRGLTSPMHMAGLREGPSCRPAALYPASLPLTALPLAASCINRPSHVTPTLSHTHLPCPALPCPVKQQALQTCKCSNSLEPTARYSKGKRGRSRERASASQGEGVSGRGVSRGRACSEGSVSSVALGSWRRRGQAQGQHARVVAP